MSSDDTVKAQIISQRYQDRRATGKHGWADEDSYARKRRVVDEILASGRIPRHCRFLELGCGNGNITLYVAQKGHESYGIDLAVGAIQWANKQAQQLHVQAHFSVGNVVTLAPYADCHFDFVFDGDCLLMTIGTDREPCVRNVFRVLKRNGVFLAKAHLLNENIKGRLSLGGCDYFDAVGHFSTVQGQPMYYYSRQEEFLSLLQESGFRIVCSKMEPLPVTDEKMPFWAGDITVKAVKP